MVLRQSKASDCLKTTFLKIHKLSTNTLSVLEMNSKIQFSGKNEGQKIILIFRTQQTV